MMGVRTLIMDTRCLFYSLFVALMFSSTGCSGPSTPEEPNDTMAQATALEHGQPKEVSIAPAADQDWFKFEVPGSDLFWVIRHDSTDPSDLRIRIVEKGAKKKKEKEWDVLEANDSIPYRKRGSDSLFIQICQDSTYVKSYEKVGSIGKKSECRQKRNDFGSFRA